MAALSTATINR